MKITDIVEARKSPQLNDKTSINAILKTELSKSTGTITGIPNLFASFTKIDKLGINPSSEYQTPIGIYCYPVNYITDIIGDYLHPRNLPFAGQSEFVNVFSITGNVLNLKTMGEQLETHLYETLKRLVKKPELQQKITNLVKLSHAAAIVNDYPGGRFWFVTYKLATSMAKNSPVFWNRIFRALKVDACIDPGLGIIHNNEPTQAVIFNISAIKNLKRHHNKYSPETVDDTKWKLSSYLNSPEVIQLNKLTDPIEAGNLITTANDFALINYVKNKKFRDQILINFPEFSGFLKHSPSRKLQTAMVDRELSAISHFKNPDQELLYKLLSKPEINSRITSIDDLDELIQKIKRPGGKLIKLVNKIKERIRNENN